MSERTPPIKGSETISRPLLLVGGSHRQQYPRPAQRAKPVLDSSCDRIRDDSWRRTRYVTLWYARSASARLRRLDILVVAKPRNRAKSGDDGVGASVPVGPEAIADSAHRFDQRIVAARRDRLAQPADVDIYGTLFDERMVAPDLVEEPGAAVEPPAVGHEEVQQAEFGRPQTDFAISGAHAARRGIQLQPRDLDQSSASCGVRLRSTALIRASSSRLENGLVT